MNTQPLYTKIAYAHTGLNEGVFPYIFTVGGYVRKKVG